MQHLSRSRLGRFLIRRVLALTAACTLALPTLCAPAISGAGLTVQSATVSSVIRSGASLSEDDAAMIATSDLLTLRKTIYAANLSENDVNQPEACKYFTQVQELAAKEGSEVLPICAKLEADIAELDDPDEKAMFMEELGLQQSGLDRLIQCSYELLGLISFLTAGADECRAWTIKKGTKAPQAAGKIHSDFERGFIRAEVIAFDDLKACGTLANAKAKGLLRSEGKEYIMHDGDVVNFLFNV